LIAIVGNAVEPSRAVRRPTESAALHRFGIRAGKSIDPERGEVLRDQMIRIAGERILGVGALRDGGLRDCARTIDLSKSTVLPGLITRSLRTRRFCVTSDWYSHLRGWR
jgi:adenine deaminase